MSIVKNFESKTDAQRESEAQARIMESTKVVKYSLHGASIKNALYILLSVVAAAELGATFYFYGSAIGVGVVVCAVAAVCLSVGYHILTHGALKAAADGLVFNIGNDSSAARLEVIGNVVIAMLLAALSACTVYLIGKPSYEAYRMAQYEARTVTEHTQTTIDAAQLTNKDGKINSVRTAAAAAFLTASHEATAATDANHQARYDATTYKIANVFGASAVVVEIALILLMLSISTARRAATIGIAAANATPTPQPLPTPTPTPTATNPPQPSQPPISRIGFNLPPPLEPNVTMIDKNLSICQHLNCKAAYQARTTFQKYCCTDCRQAQWSIEKGVVFDVLKRKSK